MTACCTPAAIAPRPNQASGTAWAKLPVVVVGAGPVGLAAIAHLRDRGLDCRLLEAAACVGAAPLAWGHVRMFSPWRYNLDKAAVAALEAHGWVQPELSAFPTGRELTERYLAPLAAVPDIASRLHLNTDVVGIARLGAGKVRDAGREEQPFEVRYTDASGEEGRVLARAVIFAAGTWGNPSPAGVSGLMALGERGAADRFRYGMADVLGADRARYAGRRVLVVGSGHSAIGTLIELAALAREAPGTSVVWATRTADLTRAYGGGTADQLPERGALGQQLRRLVEAGAIELEAGFGVDGVARTSDGCVVMTDLRGRTIRADEVVVATGLRPGLGPLSEVRLDLDPALECPRALAPLIDPNLHSCGTVRPHGAAELEQPDPGLFLAGMASYGRAPTFLLATGYEQVRSIAAALAGDLESARRVELDLPQTGVCSGGGGGAVNAAAGCVPATPPGACCLPKPVSASNAACCDPRPSDLAWAEPAE